MCISSMICFIKIQTQSMRVGQCSVQNIFRIRVWPVWINSSKLGFMVMKVPPEITPFCFNVG